MEFDIFFSISQTPVRGFTPDEATMFRNFFAQVEAADALGFGVAWIAESHYSSEVQKLHRKPVIPHWQGEVGLNVDFLQLSHHIFQRTRRIETGSAVMNIVCNGGPLAAAERVAAFLALHGLNPQEHRRIHVGFSAGRFDFMNRVTGVDARDRIEEAAWPVVKGRIFAEAAEIFVRLLRGETLSSDDVRAPVLARAEFRTDPDWQRLRELAGAAARDSIPMARRWVFEPVKIVPQQWRRDLLQLVAGSHDPQVQEDLNQFLPVQVFNLSITPAEVIEDTHRRMSRAYHLSGGPWRRSYMPRTVFVFVNEEAGLTPQGRREAARDEARAALGAYWTALEGTLDPKKVEGAADNALIGNAQDLVEQIVARFHAEDRLMLWFDFFNHDNARVIRNMQVFMEQVAPRVRGAVRA
jgi:alkanesulfonate monooxygenase SsuD/methylene tetrahydromethanopterin reductase-like flavin-dependent oxidoreductase (luciferase family)